MLISCSGKMGQSISSPKVTEQEQDMSLLFVPNQLNSPQSIKTIQLYKKGDRGNPPIYELHSNEKLVLEFDELASLNGQFTIRFTHHNRNWELSNIPEVWYLDGMQEMTITGGVKNRLSEPEYFHYKFEFPNRDFSFRVSGNYLLHVYDYESGTELFSLPFLVTEREGTLTATTEILYNEGRNGLSLEKIYGVYSYPEYVQFPQFDLSYAIVQNRFWGTAVKPTDFDISNPGKSQFYTNQQNSFEANFDFKELDLTELSLGNPQIVDWQPGTVPPKVILKDDVLNFGSDPKPVWKSEFGKPKNGRDARYAEVQFNFDTGTQFNASDEFYLVGDFNQWATSRKSRLYYNPKLNLWQVSALIKEGIYSYKYVVKKGDSQEFIPLNDAITRQKQEYISIVYYEDAELHFERILNTQIFFSGY